MTTWKLKAESRSCGCLRFEVGGKKAESREAQSWKK
jgi:hypothetical protein